MAYMILFFYIKIESEGIFLNEIGLLFKLTRERSGVSLKEASEDIKVNELLLKNIEDGNIGSFKDISVLKNFIKIYAKYLGLNENEVIDEFNNYMYEYTSKIPIKNIEKAIREKNRLEKKEDRIYSPYTKSKVKDNSILLYFIYSVAVLLFILTVFYVIKLIFFS